MGRYAILDRIRGITLISMILYHLLWDVVNLYGVQITWYDGMPGYLWQQSICQTFIVLSGFCWSLGRKKWKRGVTVFAGGVAVTVVTIIFMPQERVVFGILTMIGSAMIVMVFTEKILKRVNPFMGCVLSVFLFVICRNINRGWLGYGEWNLVSLPNWFYQNYFTAFWGFPFAGFDSTDYFSFFPWYFLFCAGYFLFKGLEETQRLPIKTTKRGNVLEWLGRNSLLCYLLHQPVLYVVTMIYYLK